MVKKRFLLWEAVATLVGTIIGAGILGIPYVVAKAGFWTGVLDILLLGVVVLLIYLYLGEVVLRTKGFHQLPGYAERYLGKTGKRLMTFCAVFGNYGALIAYIMGVGAALAAIFGGPSLFFSVIFFVVVSLIVYLGLKAVAESEAMVQPLIIGLILLVAAVSIGNIEMINFTEFSIMNILLPYGVILFAFLGAPAVPEMREELIGNEKLLKKAILIGACIPIAAYLLFAIAIVGVTGIGTTEIATIGLGKSIGEYMIIIGNIMATMTMSTSFLTLGLALKETYMLDYKVNDVLAWALTVFIPLAVALSGITSFIKVIGLVGVIAGGLEGVLIILMAIKAKKHGNRKPEYSIPLNWLIASLLIILFSLGAGYYLWSMF